MARLLGSKVRAGFEPGRVGGSWREASTSIPHRKLSRSVIGSLTRVLYSSGGPYHDGSNPARARVILYGGFVGAPRFSPYRSVAAPRGRGVSALTSRYSRRRRAGCCR